MKSSLPATEDAVRSRHASPRPLRVVHTPFIAQNAYQPRLLEELRKLGIDARGAKRSNLPLLRRRADAVHFHWIQHRWFGYRLARGMVCEAFFAQLRAMRAQGTRLVWTIHNLVPHECDDHNAELRLLARMCRSVDACIVHSQYARDAVIAAVDPQGRDGGLCARLHVIPHGNYIGCYQPRLDRDAERARLGVSSDETLFAFVGQIREYKQVDTLIHAFRSANAHRTKLLVCGRPKGDRVARSLYEARGDDPRIKFELGFLPDDALASALLASDAVVLPYRDSLTSGAALLAMSYGRTVVAPDIGCFGELLGTGSLGLYAAEGANSGASSTEELARALVEVAARADSRVATGAAHLERARSFDWPTIARTTAALYGTP
jgi:glycosyltransferase involved in cell wall biosynthesis